jgi:hypothetical protein
MMTEKIVAPRNVKMADFHQSNDTILGKPGEQFTPPDAKKRKR